MKPISILIESEKTIQELMLLSKETSDDDELGIVLEIYKESGYEAAKASLTKYPVGVDVMPKLTTKQVRTIHGWLDVLTCMPVAGTSRYACTFSHNPKLVYLLDKNGWALEFLIYQIRDAKKPKKSKTEAIKQRTKELGVPVVEIKSSTDPDLLEPAFPLISN
ncbi:hypothetical protein nACB1_093 [Acinetobacter phage nACB1]|nr:hypothetical protein nACB1_093 [Acinetobacter phage nACB1]